MRVIAVIEDQDLIRKILTHLGLWQSKARPRPVAHGPPDLAAAPFNDWLAPSADDYLTDPLYPDEAHFWKILRPDVTGSARKQAKTGLT
jgi:hypothetical protein